MFISACTDGGQGANQDAGVAISDDEWPFNRNRPEDGMAASGRPITLYVSVETQKKKISELWGIGSFDRDRLIREKCCKEEALVFLFGQEARLDLPGTVDIYNPVLVRVEGTYQPDINDAGKLINRVEVDQLRVIRRFQPPEPATPKAEKFHVVGTGWWDGIVRTPDVWSGTNVIVYAVVVQQDANTGGNAFLASASNSQIWDPSSGDLAYFVSSYATVHPGDRLRMKATVLGAQTYDTVAGGSNTVPSFDVSSLKRLN